MPNGVTLIGYADDLAVVVTAKEVQMLEVVAEHALHNINEWMEQKQLKLAPQKTEVVLLVGGRRNKSITLRLEDMMIQSQESLRYLGIHLDRNMRMGIHIRKTAEKASKAIATLSHLMPNAGGPREGSRRILSSVVQSIMLYGATVWEKAMERKVHRAVFLSIQRRTAIRMISAYRTTSTKALLVLARTPPIDLQAKQRVQLEREGIGSKGNAYTTLLDNWQRQWESNEGTAEWTKALIRDVRPWVKRKHGELSYHLTQLMTGHGCFRAYLYRFKLTETDACLCCGVSDTAEHTFFECPKWSEQRVRTQLKIGTTLTPTNLVDIMLEGEENWRAVNTLAQSILSIKERTKN